MENFLLPIYRNGNKIDKLEASMLIRQCNDQRLIEFAEKNAIPNLTTLFEQAQREGKGVAP
jgi:hypothetical protein